MDKLLLEMREEILWVTLNRPKIHNAFDQELIAQLTGAFRRVGENPDQPTARAVVLAGRGKSFCAGADLQWMRQMKDCSREENYKDSLCLANMLEAIQQCPLPVVGRVHGAALGGGVGLMAACDYVLMDDSAQWGLTEINLGLVPAVISPAVMQKIGPGHARALFLTGVRLGAGDALRLGLAHEICPDGRGLEQRLQRLLQQIKQTAPQAARMAKELIWLNQSFGQRPAKIKDLTCQMIATQRVSPEGQEGMAAMLEKRPPHWKSE